MIISPPKIYLDTNHLVNIGRLQEGRTLGSSEQYRDDYCFILKCLRDGCCAIIFNLYAPLEWAEGDSSEDSMLQLGSIFDQAQCIYQAEADTIFYAQEIIKQCKDIDPSISFPNLPILHHLEPDGSFQPAYSIIAQNAPGFNLPIAESFPESVPVVSRSDHVLAALRWTREKPEIHESRVTNFRAAFEETKSMIGPGFQQLPKESIIDWMKRFLQIETMVPECMLGQVDIEKCPGIYLYVKIWENMLKTKQTVTDNDCDDIIYLAIIPYADISLIERSLRGQIVQVDRNYSSKVFSKPSEAAQTLKNLVSP